jgi:hypothetical protein
MKSAKKHSFYPVNEVEKVLHEVPKGHLSDRVNELILKGLSFEQQEKVAIAYQQYDSKLSATHQRIVEDSSVRLLSEGAFTSEDEVEDYI